MSALAVPDPAERADLGAFVARVVRLDAAAVVRLVAAGDTVRAWAETPFSVLATRTVHGRVDPPDVTAPASALLTALAVERADTVDPGAGGPWLAALPPSTGWAPVDEVPGDAVGGLAERGIALARRHAGPMGPPASLMDQTVLTVTADDGGAPAVKVPLRCLLALSGMGFLDGGDPVRVSAAGSWSRLDATFGAVVHRRVVSLPLIVAS